MRYTLLVLAYFPLMPAGNLLAEAGGGAGFAPGALGDAHGTAEVFIEKRDAFVEIDVPFLLAANQLLFRQYRFGRAGVFAYAAVGAEIIDP